MNSSITMTESLINKYTTGEVEFSFADMKVMLEATSLIESELADNVNYEAETGAAITEEQQKMSAEDLALAKKVETM